MTTLADIARFDANEKLIRLRTVAESFPGLFWDGDRGTEPFGVDENKFSLVKELEKYGPALFPGEENPFIKLKEQIRSCKGDIDRVNKIAAELAKKALEKLSTAT